jgi:hypothetical protein
MQRGGGRRVEVPLIVGHHTTVTSGPLRGVERPVQ